MGRCDLKVAVRWTTLIATKNNKDMHRITIRNITKRFQMFNLPVSLNLDTEPTVSRRPWSLHCPWHGYGASRAAYFSPLEVRVRPLKHLVDTR